MPQVVLSDKKDTSGQAQVRRRAPPSCTATTAAPIDAGLQQMAPVSVQEAGAEEICTDTTTEVEVIPPARQSRTTEWRRRKALAAQMVLGETQLKIRKERCCRLCGKHIGSEGHSQFRGKIYCPHRVKCLSTRERSPYSANVTIVCLHGGTATITKEGNSAVNTRMYRH